MLADGSIAAALSTFGKGGMKFVGKDIQKTVVLSIKAGKPMAQVLPMDLKSIWRSESAMPKTPPRLAGSVYSVCAAVQ